MLWIVLIFVAVFVFASIYQDSNNEAKTTSTAVSDNTESVSMDDGCVMEFLHSYHSLCNQHEIDGTEILLTWWGTTNGFTEIRIHTRIFKIDGQDASERVDILRMAMSLAKRQVEENNTNLEPADLYSLKQKAADKVVLDFFGTDTMTGSFWDIENCEYIDGKYLEFESNGVIFTQNKSSVNKALGSICAKIREKYPDTRINRNANDMIIISSN